VNGWTVETICRAFERSISPTAKPKMLGDKASRGIVESSWTGWVVAPIYGVISNLNRCYNLRLIPLFLRNVFADKEIQEHMIRESGLDWVIVRPTALTNGPHTGRCLVGSIGHWFFPSKISRADVAEFLLRQVVSNEYLRKSRSPPALPIRSSAFSCEHDDT
jgi:hypothetical protein